MGETPRHYFSEFATLGESTSSRAPPLALLKAYQRVVALLMKWAQLQEAAGARRRTLQSQYHLNPQTHLSHVDPYVTLRSVPAMRMLMSHRFSRASETESTHQDFGGAEDELMHVILQDSSLPNVSGAEFIKQLRNETSHRIPLALTFLSSGLDEYEERFLTSVLANHLPALIRAARQKNSEQRIEQLLQAIAPADPLAESQLRMAEDTAVLRAEFFKRVPASTSSQVSARAGFKTKNTYQTVHRWRMGKKIFAVKHGGQDLYPDFQFGFDGYPRPIIEELLAIFARHPARSDWDNALWFAAANAWLGGKLPMELLDTAPEKVKDAAEQEVLPDDG